MAKAVINGDRIECGKCGALLQKIVEVNKPIHGEALMISGTIDEFGTGCYIGCGLKLEIKCTHKDKGKKCGEINTIEL
jgi:hypothetical protein